MEIALVGDVHGHINLLYDKVMNYTPQVDCIITTGDFCCFRKQEDYISTKIPYKYRSNSFEFNDYYLGLKKVPKKTYTIGGNHEPNGFFKEVWEGSGQLAKEVIFIGYHGSFLLNNVKFVGISGNYSYTKFNNKRESMPLKFYRHFFKEDLDYVKELNQVDVLITHDWADCCKHFFKGRRGTPEKLSPQLTDLINKKSPKLLVSGHMHVYVDKILENGTRFLSLNRLHEHSKPLDTIKYQDLLFHIYN